MTTTAYVTHPDYALHTLEGHPEHAGRIRRVWEVMDGSDILLDLMRVDPTPATTEQLSRVHDPRYIDHIKRASGVAAETPEKAVLLDPDTYVTPVSFDAACLSAGGVLGAVEAIISGRADNALAVTRLRATMRPHTRHGVLPVQQCGGKRRGTHRPSPSTSSA
jgi:acetoin utilization deacetylase AcuC-like enzyme